MQSSIVRGVKVVYCMICLIIPEGKTAPEEDFITRLTACVYVLMGSIYCRRTF